MNAADDFVFAETSEEWREAIAAGKPTWGMMFRLETRSDGTQWAITETAYTRWQLLLREFLEANCRALDRGEEFSLSAPVEDLGPDRHRVFLITREEHPVAQPPTNY
jgi:hypothetical protein